MFHRQPSALLHSQSMPEVSSPAAAGDLAPVFLLDTMSFIFRAYHAMQRARPMTTRGGQPTAAIFVFVNMLERLRKEFAPVHLAAVFDLSGEVFRDATARQITTLKKWSAAAQGFIEVDYAGYKANREAMPEDLSRQIPFIRRAIEAMRIPVLAAEGYEADDVIGTLAAKAAAEGHPVFIVSPDKDMMQLVTDRVRILNPQKENLVLDPAKVEEVLGVPPERVVDVMALRGDAVDNVPGAPGIGDKGSVELIREFGSLDGLLERADEVKRKGYRESLLENRETVLLSRELVTIHTSVPVALDLEAMRVGEPDADALRALYTELEFTSMLRAFTPAEAEGRTVMATVEEPGEDEVAAFIVQAGPGFALVLDADSAVRATDAETDDAPPAQSMLNLAEPASVQTETKPLRVGVAATEGPALTLALAEPLLALLADAGTPKIAHDAKSLLHRLADRSVAFAGPLEDTMLLSWLLNPTHATQTLADVAARNGAPPITTPATAARAIAMLHPALIAEAEKLDLIRVYREIDRPLTPVLFAMERAGIRVDLAALAGLSTRFAAEMQTAAERIFSLAGARFNLNSPKQLGEVLFVQMGLPHSSSRGKSKSLSTAQDVLEGLAEEHEIARLILDHRHLSKLKSTYIDTLPTLVDSDARVHTTFQAAATATGRLSSINPNLQNIPVRTELGREIRAAFIASPGNVLLSADYSQIELRLLAHYSEDPLLMEAYRTGQDIHSLTASEVFGIPIDQLDKTTRNRAKAVNFGIVYGISPFGLAAQLGIPQTEARQYIERYFERYRGVRSFIDRTLDEVRREGSVRTLFGRLRPIPDLDSRNPAQRGFAERTAINTPLQGTAADLIKLAMIALDRALASRGLGARLVLQVHDELLLDVPESETTEVAALVKESMESVATLRVPLEADVAIGANWRDME